MISILPDYVMWSPTSLLLTFYPQHDTRKIASYIVLGMSQYFLSSFL